MRTHKISWFLYIIGCLLVFGQWIRLVPTALGWFGWLLALGGWAIGNAQHRQAQSRSRAEEIAKLNLLREEGIVTDEEFAKEKERVLQEPWWYTTIDSLNLLTGAQKRNIPADRASIRLIRVHSGSARLCGVFSIDPEKKLRPGEEIENAGRSKQVIARLFYGRNGGRTMKITTTERLSQFTRLVVHVAALSALLYPQAVQAQTPGPTQEDMEFYCGNIPAGHMAVSISGLQFGIADAVANKQTLQCPDGTWTANAGMTMKASFTPENFNSSRYAWM
jgi:hypothetical protein